MVVGSFRGPEMAYDEVPPEEVIYVISFEPRLWIVPEAPERFLNHSCSPNCQLLPDRKVVTLRRVAAGEELTIAYDWADREQMSRCPEHYFWDPRWSFECRCGAPGCRGRIDRYRPE